MRASPLGPPTTWSPRPWTRHNQTVILAGIEPAGLCHHRAQTQASTYADIQVRLRTRNAATEAAMLHPSIVMRIFPSPHLRFSWSSPFPDRSNVNCSPLPGQAGRSYVVADSDTMPFPPRSLHFFDIRLQFEIRFITARDPCRCPGRALARASPLPWSALRISLVLSHRPDRPRARTVDRLIGRPQQPCPPPRAPNSPMPSSAAMRSPVTAWSWARSSAASSVTSSARSRARLIST